MVEAVLEPFGKTTLNRLERLSAAEAIRFFHFYFMGSPEGLGFRYLKRDSMSAVIEPLRRRFESLGGKLELGTGATELFREGAGITRVVAHLRPEMTGNTFSFDPARVSVSPFAYLSTGLYVDSLAMYEDFFPRDRIAVLLYEEMVGTVSRMRAMPVPSGPSTVRTKSGMDFGARF
jgi:hypothetical protein